MSSSSAEQLPVATACAATLAPSLFFRTGLQQAPQLYLVSAPSREREALCEYLLQHRLQVTPIASAEEMMRRMHRLRPEAVVLDAGLPGMSGLEACRQLRADGDRLGVILLAEGDDEVDRVLALELGADDVVSRPFSDRELLARVRAVLRRAAVVPAMPAATGELWIGERRFDLASRCIEWRGERHMLGVVEYALLAELSANPLRPLSRERLQAVSHPGGRPASSRAVDAAILRLRKLVEPDPARPRHIRTVRGHGYLFVPGRG
jgi:two-component system phosphate regulon response regulator OmpR